MFAIDRVRSPIRFSNRTLAGALRSPTSTAAWLLAVLLAIGLGACNQGIVPQFDPAPGTYAGTQSVAITFQYAQAEIRYTTDGSKPTCKKGSVYAGPISISRNTTLSAIACAEQYQSDVAKGSYIITPVAAAPTFMPMQGTYQTMQAVAIVSATADATIRYTTDGSHPTCSTGFVYGGMINVAATTTINAVACAAGIADSAVATALYVINLPQAAAPVFSHQPGTFTGAQQVAISSDSAGASIRYSTDGADPTCASGLPYGGPVSVANTMTLKAIACAPGMSPSEIASAGYTIEPASATSVWRSIDIDSPPNFAACSTTTNENGNAVNITGRGKFESSNQVFRLVYAEISGNFTFTARLDGVDFAGLANNQARVGLIFTPNFSATGGDFLYGGALLAGDGTHRRADRLATGGSAGTSTVNLTGNGVRYMRIVRTGNQYQTAFSLDGGVTYTAAAARTFAAPLPELLYVGFAVSSASSSLSAAATFSDVHIFDGNGNLLIGPDEFTGDIGEGPGGGGGGGDPDPDPGTGGGGSPNDNSRGATPPEPALLSGSVAKYNIEGYAAASVTGGGNIAEGDPRYRKVTTATEFVAALRAARAADANPVKVIEIMNDLNMGWNEVGTALQADGLLRQNITAKKHPDLIASGVSLLDIMNFNGLTIFSKNGATLRHVEFNIKNGTNLILRNLRFDELWEWDEATRGDYDSNDWDFVTIGDGGGVTSGIWVDHCTFTKSFDGVVDVKKGASGITISWSEVVPADSGPGSFVRRQFEHLEANRGSNTMYNFLRGFFSQQQVIDVALPQKKGHLIGATSLEGLTSYTVTLHHNHYKDLQDRMPRLRSGDVHAYNLYVDNFNARVVKVMRDEVVAANPTLRSAVEGNSPNYKFGITLNGAISTEGGAIQVERSVFWGVLTPLRNNQTNPSDARYTGAIRALNVRHVLLATDTEYMPATSQRATFSDRGYLWASWQGDSTATDSTLGPSEAPEIPFAWHNGAPSYPMALHQVDDLAGLLTGAQGAGAGKIGMTTAQWLRVNN